MFDQHVVTYATFSLVKQTTRRARQQVAFALYQHMPVRCEYQAVFSNTNVRQKRTDLVGGHGVDQVPCNVGG